MTCDEAKLCHQKGSSVGGDKSPLFPPVHVNDTGMAAGLRAPPRNKMALFEQFTVPCSTYLPSNKLATPECTSRQEDIYSKYTKHGTLAPIIVPNKGLGRIGKSSHGLSLDRISTCSAVVNVDNSERFQADETSVVLSTKLEMIPGKDSSLNDRLFKCIQNLNLAEATGLSSHGDFKGEICEQITGASLEGVQMSGEGIGNNVTTENNSAMEWSSQLQKNIDWPPSAGGSQLNVAKRGNSRNKVALKFVQAKALAQLKNDVQHNIESNGNPLEKLGISSHHGEALLSAGDKVRTLLTIIKPKDVIQTVGQQFFWKARKAIIRQQEVFSEQVFELHKLIEVQKLMAKMPRSLMEGHLVARIASDNASREVYPVKMNSRKLEKKSKRAQDAPASNRCEGEEHRSRHKPRLQAMGESGPRAGVGASHKKRASNIDFPQTMTNASFGQAPHSSSSDGISAWGYPLASLNRPFFCLPGVGRFPSGTGLGAAYPVNTSQPMAPFTFPCYAPRPEQQTPVFYPINQWSNPVNYHPFLTPMSNDWFAINHPSHMPIASGSERLGPTHSVASINMRVEASSQSMQPAVIPLMQRQVEKINHTRLAATKSYGSVATASVSTAPNAMSGKPEVGNAGELNKAAASNPHVGSGFVPTRMWGAFGGDQNRAVVGARGQSKGSKTEVWCSLGDREAGRVNDITRERNVQNLFPSQPASSSLEGQVQRQGEGSHRGVIKAVPRSAWAASESTAGILLTIQRERKV